MTAQNQFNNPGIERIFHPTDFSEASRTAFRHALTAALQSHSALDLMHVAERGEEVHWGDFPGVRGTLEGWGILPKDSTHEDLERLGIGVSKVISKAHDPVDGALDYLSGHHADLIVLATHQDQGGARWLHKHVAEPLARHSHELTLFIPEGVEGFVSPHDGSVNLKHIVVAVDRQPHPQHGVEGAARLAAALGCKKATFTVLHAGTPGSMPELHPVEKEGWSWEVTALEGPVVETILEAEDWAGADLIVMTTTGHHGFLDALRGSTTEQVLRRARCPVLAVPAMIHGPE